MLGVRQYCRDRNGHTDSYRVIYGSSAAPYYYTIIGAQIISGNEDSNRIFSATGLPPRSSYIFQVQAANVVLDVRGTAGTLIVSTTAPQGTTYVFIDVVMKHFVVHFADFGFLFAGQLYPNNSVVTLTDVSNRFFGPALYPNGPIE